MKSAGKKVEGQAIDKGVVARMVALIKQGKEPEEVGQELHLKAEQVTAYFGKEAARQIGQWELVKGQVKFKIPRIWQLQQTASDIFNTKQIQFHVENRPDIKLVPQDLLDSPQIKRLQMSEDYLSYVAPSNHDGLKAGHTYWFKARDISEKTNFLDPVVYADHLFASKKPAGLLSGFAVKNDKVDYHEAKALKEGGYVAVRSQYNISGEKGLAIRAGEICWMERAEAEKQNFPAEKGLTDKVIQQKKRDSEKAGRLAQIAERRRSAGAARVKE